MLDAGAFSDDGVVGASKGLIRILADAGKDMKLFEKYAVSGMPTVLFLDPEGKQVGSMRDRSPAGVKAQFEEISAKHARGPKYLDGAAAAVDAAKAGSRPAALLFVDGGPKSDVFQKMLGDAAFGPEIFEKVSFSKVEYKKDSDEAKKYKVTAAPTLVLLDASGDEPKVIKKVTGGNPKSLKKDLEDAVKACEKR